MKQNKNYTRNITTIDTLKNISIIEILKNFPCTLISGAFYFIIISLLMHFYNYKEPLFNIIDGLTLYMCGLSSVDEILFYLLKDEPKITDELRLNIKLIALIFMLVVILLSTGIGIYIQFYI